MNSNLSLIKFNVSATIGSSNIKPIFNLLPEFPDQCLHRPLWSVSWARVVLSAVGSGGCIHCPLQNHKKRNPLVSDQAIVVIGNKTLVTSTNLWLTWGTFPVLSSKVSLHCNNRFSFVKCSHREHLLRPGCHFTVLMNSALPGEQNAQLAPI
jgi:hypothetical protein